MFIVDVSGNRYRGYTEDSPLEMSYIGITDITGWWNEDSGEITATGTVRISPIRDVCHRLRYSW